MLSGIGLVWYFLLDVFWKNIATLVGTVDLAKIWIRIWSMSLER